jgi:NADPH-dependent 2,4-dienoyl-CoA reductase/sulfur reductase-like enzyme
MREVELLIVGAGPAGLSAACEAAKAGVQVMIIDENLRPGGQLFKQIHKFFGSRVHRAGTRGFRIGFSSISS